MKTAEQIKTEAINNGVEEWFFDSISDNELEKYTVDQIVDLFNETQNQEENYKIKADDIRSENIPDAIKEIENDPYLSDMARHIANYKNWGISDAVEAIATHIIITAEDYSL